jgi:hypothetical protein
MSVFLFESAFSRCGRQRSWPVPHVERVPAVTPPKTSIISSLPHLARWGAAKLGTGSCRTAAPAAPPLGGSRWGGAVSESSEALHPQCRLNKFGDGGRSVGLTLGRGKSAGVNLSLGSIPCVAS